MPTRLHPFPAVSGCFCIQSRRGAEAGGQGLSHGSGFSVDGIGRRLHGQFFNTATGKWRTAQHGCRAVWSRSRADTLRSAEREVSLGQQPQGTLGDGLCDTGRHAPKLVGAAPADHRPGALWDVGVLEIRSIRRDSPRDFENSRRSLGDRNGLLRLGNAPRETDQRIYRQDPRA